MNRCEVCSGPIDPALPDYGTTDHRCCSQGCARTFYTATHMEYLRGGITSLYDVLELLTKMVGNTR